MSAWTSGNYTKKGLSLLTKLTQGSSLKITRAVVGTGYVKPDVLANQTAVSGIKQNLRFKAASYPETGTCKLPMFLTNEGLTTGYKARQVGLYAMDPDEGEILYFITQSESGMDVPSETIMPEYSATWAFYFRYGQADNVNVTVDPSHTITEDMLNEVRIIAETGVSVPKHGAMVELENTAKLPLVNLKLYGKTTQIGTPTPENPADLIGVENPVVSVTGLNIWDEETELGYWQSVNGEAYTATNQIRSKNFIPIIPNATIYVTAPNNKTIDFVFYDRHKSFLSGRSVARVITAPSEAYYMHINLRSDYGTTYKNNVCVSMIPLNGAYEKTSGKQTIAIPHTLHGIPVASGGNYTDTDGQQWLCDEIDFEKGVLITRIGRVDMGTIDWSISASGIFKKTKPDDMAFTTNTPAFLCALYNVAYTASAQNWEAKADKSIGFRTDECLVVKDSAYTDAATFKTAMSGVMLYYELTTPIETALSFAELEAYNALTSSNPHTTIINDGGANMEADCFLAQHETAFERIFNNTNTKAKKATEITDNAVAMVKDVHEDSAPYAKVLEIGGMTRKCRNLIPYPYFESSKESGDVKLTVGEDGGISGTGTPTSLIGVGLLSTEGSIDLCSQWKDTITFSVHGTFANLVLQVVIIAESTEVLKEINISSGSVTYKRSDYPNAYKINCVVKRHQDNVAMSGTIYAMCNVGTEPLPYEPYFDGLRSAPVTEVESVGANLFYVPYFNSYNATDCSLSHTDGGFLVTPTGSDPYWFYINKSFGLEDGEYYVYFSVDGGAYAVVQNTGGIIHKSGSLIPFGVENWHFELENFTIGKTYTVKVAFTKTPIGEYTPYRRNTLPIPAAVQALDGYGWGISDTLYNYIDWERKQFVKIVGKTVFDGSADEAWAYYTGSSNPCFRAPLRVSNKENCALCSHFKHQDYPYIKPTGTKGIFGWESSFALVYFASGQTSLDEWIAWLSANPVTVYYKLATPVITDISDLLPDDNLIGVEGGGTVTMVNEYGYDTPNTVEFSIGNNAAVGSRSFVGDLHGTAARAKADAEGKPLATQEWVLEQLASLAAATLALNQ